MKNEKIKSAALGGSSGRGYETLASENSYTFLSQLKEDDPFEKARQFLASEELDGPDDSYSFIGRLKHVNNNNNHNNTFENLRNKFNNNTPSYTYTPSVRSVYTASKTIENKNNPSQRSSSRSVYNDDLEDQNKESIWVLGSSTWI